MTNLFLWTPVAVYMAALFYASSLTSIPGPVDAWFSDTVLHASAYAGLACVSLRALARGRWAGVTMGTLAGAWLIATLYGVTDEAHQMFVPGRTAELRDLFNDGLGALAAVAAAGAWGIMNARSRAQ